MDEEQQIVDYLILNGALEMAGISDSGEPLYNFTQNLKNIMPDLYEEHMRYVNSSLMDLWQNGFIDLDLFEENPTVRLTEKSFDNASIMELSDTQRFSLEEIKRIILP